MPNWACILFLICLFLIHLFLCEYIYFYLLFVLKYLKHFNIAKLSAYCIHYNKGIRKPVLSCFNNSLKEFPKNIIFGKNINLIFIQDNDIKFKYYSNYLSKIDKLSVIELNNNLIFEKLILLYIKSLFMPAIYQTPHICLTKVLKNNDDKIDIEINLPKNFLSMSSWI